MAKEVGVKRSINTKIYTSTEEVISDYENKDNVNSLVFFDRIITIPIKVNNNGNIEFGLAQESLSNDMKLLMSPGDGAFYGVERNFLLKTPDLVAILEKWSRLVLSYSEEMNKISEFIKNGGYKWVSYSLGNSPPLPKIYLINELYDRGLVERLKSTMLNMGERNLSSFIEESFKWTEKTFGYFELLIDGRMRSKVGFDFDLNEREESFINKAKEVDEFFREFGNLFSWAHDVEGWLIAIFGELGKGSRANLGNRSINYGKTNLFNVISVNEFLDEERERYEKIGVLSLYPEIFLIPGEGEPYGLSTPCSKPKILEVGIVLLGHRKVGVTNPTYEMLFFPFAATKTEVAMGLFKYVKRKEHDPGTRRYYPVLMGYESKSSKTEKPTFQMLSFSQGPTLSLVCDYFEYNEKEESIYSPLVEYASSPSGEEKSIKARRIFVAETNKANKVYKNEGKKKRKGWVNHVIKGILNAIDIPSMIESQTDVNIDLTERSKISEMVAFVKDLVKVSRKEEMGSELVLKDPFDIKRDDWIEEIVKEICYSGSDGKKVRIMATGDFTKNEKNLLRMGASIGGNLDIDIYGKNVYSEDIKNLYDVILTSIRRLSYKNGDNLASILKEASNHSEEIRKIYRIRIGQEEEAEEAEKVNTRLKKLLFKNPDKTVGYAIAKMAKLLMPKIGEALEEVKGPNMTVLFEYIPKIRLNFYPDIKEDEETGEEEVIEDPEVLFKKGYHPHSVEINSVLKSAVIFLDFKEEGFRVASVNVFS